MISKLIHKLLEPRHYWRTIGFDELSELYVSQLLRSLGVSLIGLFTPIYLYKLGYSLTDIALFHVFWFLLRPVLDVVNGFIVAKIGPKHTMLLGAFMHVVYLALVLSLKDMHWPLFLVAGVGSSAYALHLIAMYVDFSKVKHSTHGGKELGYLAVVERVGGALGPLAGGLIASFYDPRYTVGLAMFILILSAIPLFFTAEAVQVNQHISYKGLDYKSHIRDYISVLPFTLENVVSAIVWPLYAAVFLLGANTFAKLGAIATLSTISCIVLSRYIGSVIDDKKGRSLLRGGVVLNAIVHLVRPFIGGVSGVVVVNVVNEPITAAYRMPYMKGFYDASDSLPGYRIAYLSSMNVVDSCARLLFWLCVWVLMHYFVEKNVLIGTFYAASLFSLGILLEKFKALQSKRVAL